MLPKKGLGWAYKIPIKTLKLQEHMNSQLYLCFLLKKEGFLNQKVECEFLLLYRGGIFYAWKGFRD